MTLGYPRHDVVLGLKGQGHRVNKCIFDTNVLYIIGLGLVSSCRKPLPSDIIIIILLLLLLL